jgi:hypothetical protein
MWRRLLMRRGAEKIAAEARNAEIDRLWQESDEASAALLAAIRDAPKGAELKVLPEYMRFKEAAAAFNAGAVRVAEERGMIPVGYFDPPTTGVRS